MEISSDVVLCRLCVMSFRFAVVVGGELEQSLEEEGRTGAAIDIVKVKDWVQPSCPVGIIKQSHTPKNFP